MLDEDELTVTLPLRTFTNVIKFGIFVRKTYPHSLCRLTNIVCFMYIVYLAGTISE